MPPKPEQGFREIDLRSGACVATCFIAYQLLSLIPTVGIFFNLCVICIAAVFVTELTWKATWQAGLVRLLITTIGVVIALVPVAADVLVGNEILTAVLFVIGAVCSLVAAKKTGKMYVQCKLACVSYILTVYTFHGAQYAVIGRNGFIYAGTWVVSTVTALLVCTLTMFVWDAIKNAVQKKKK